MTSSILQALIVTFLWSTSWVLIKIGLGNLPPLTFAGLRYTMAFLILVPLLLGKERRRELQSLTRQQWGSLLLLGIVYYTLTQGSQFVGLAYLPANTLSLLLTLSGISIALFGRLFLDERLRPHQWLGVFVSVAGALVYFGDVGPLPFIGLLVGLFTVLSNSVGAIMGRAVNRAATISPLLVTVVSMGFGSLLLLLSGLLTEPFPTFLVRDWLIILWLAAANTAFAFTLWNHTLRTLTAAQSSVINNTMLIQIAILAWVFLGERLGPVEILGLVIASAGSVLVQLQRKPLAAQKSLS
ncbi:MAG: DMT family transporter [Chloroflexi bacterium]|nr:DMT family transporter [Chloroflexota bacterium]